MSAARENRHSSRPAGLWALIAPAAHAARMVLVEHFASRDPSATVRTSSGSRCDATRAGSDHRADGVEINAIYERIVQDCGADLLIRKPVLRRCRLLFRVALLVPSTRWAISELTLVLILLI